MRKKNLWRGWFFDGTHLHDPYGNQFTDESIHRLMDRNLNG